jgi:hypothetical protein
MTALQRGLLVFYSSVWVAACCGLIILAWNDTKMLDIETGDFLARAFITTDGATRWAFTALMAALGLPGILTFSYALTWQPGVREGYLRTLFSGEREGEVPAAEIERMIQSELESYPEVRQASVRLRMKRGSVDPSIQLLTDYEAPYSRMESIAGEMTAMILREQLGATPQKPAFVTISVDVPPPPPEPVVPEPDPYDLGDEPRVPYIDWEGDANRYPQPQLYQARSRGTRPVRRYESRYVDDD